MILADAVLRTIATRCPQNLTELTAIPGIGPSKIDKYGADLIALCRGTAPPQKPAAPATSSQTLSFPPDRPATTLSSRPETSQPHREAAVERPAALPATTPGSHHARVGQSPSAVRENKRPASPPPPSELTPAQLALESRLKDWRRDEARAAGLPSFFILSDTVLRAIAQTGPQTLGELATVRGLAADKLDRFGAALLAVVKG
jgi:ATP-dependent DNA helicase RecQ